jgi:seryl-tRNA synthetase
MTNREFFKAIVKANINADLTAHAEAEIAKLDKKNAKRKAEVGQVKEENKPVAEAIVKALANGTMLSVDLAKAIGQTTQKTNGVAGEMCKIGTITKSKVKVKGKGEQTAYTLATTTEEATEEVADEVAE